MAKTEPVKITVLRKLKIDDLFDEYAAKGFESECPIFKIGQEFIARQDYVPEGFCRWRGLTSSETSYASQAAATTRT